MYEQEIKDLQDQLQKIYEVEDFINKMIKDRIMWQIMEVKKNEEKQVQS